jgi:tRNA dimethylallyltransferase
VRLVLDLDRAALYARIDARFDAMLRAGALDEAARLQALGLDPALPAMKAVGVAPLLAHLDGAVSLDEAAARAKTETRRYAKRQLTWFRRQMPDWPRLDATDPGAALDLALRLVATGRVPA